VEVIDCPPGTSGLLLGIWNCGWFPILKNSARNDSLWRSVNEKSFSRPRSKFTWLGPRKLPLPSGNAADVAHALPHSLALVIDKEKRAVVHDGSAQEASVLVALKRGARRVEEVPRIEIGIAQEFVNAPVKLIGTGF
jgi:hypothetical protein